MKRSRLIDELTKNDLRNKRAERLACLGTWSINMENQSLRTSDEMYRIWGFDPNLKDNDVAKFIACVHPEDQEFIQDKIENLHHQIEIDTFTIKLVIDGNVKYVHNGVTVVRDAANKILSVTGYVQDVTEKRVAMLERDRNIAVLTKRNETLKNFTWVVSHNLRAPIANILGLAQILHVLNHEEQQQAVSNILCAANALDNIVNELNTSLQVKE